MQFRALNMNESLKVILAFWLSGVWGDATRIAIQSAIRGALYLPYAGLPPHLGHATRFEAVSKEKNCGSAGQDRQDDIVEVLGRDGFHDRSRERDHE